MIKRERGGVSPNRKRHRAESQIQNPRFTSNFANITSSSSRSMIQLEDNKSSHANAEEPDEGSYEQHPRREVILLIENKDLKWKDQPWILMQRYLGTASYETSYKHIYYYERILIITDSCQFRHYPHNNSPVYSSSEVIIKRIISPDTWGIPPFQETEYIDPEHRVILKYCYYDYVNAFYKVFLYENQKKKHSWYFRICSEVSKHNIPNWFYRWWLLYGPSKNILPEPYKGLYNQWVEISPKIDRQHDNGLMDGMPLLQYFIRFEIPWFWKWTPEVDFNTQQIPCLRRVFFSKFCKKMLNINEYGIMESQETVEKIKQAITS